MTPDEERLQRYLEWRRTGDRDRAERRRRAIGYVAAPALCVIAVGLAAWLGRPSGDRAPTVNAVAPAIPRTSVTSSPAPVSDGRESATSSPAPSSDARALGPEQPTVELSEPPARPRTAPRVASRPRIRPAPSSRPAPAAPVAAPVPPPAVVTGESDVAAAVAPAPVSPPSETSREAASPERREAVSEAPREPPSEGLPTPVPSDVVALPAPQPVDAVQDPPVQNPPSATTAPSGGAVAVAPTTVRERVAGWARGEVQEFRDGVDREIAEFRSGYVKVRDFFRRRDARPPTR